MSSSADESTTSALKTFIFSYTWTIENFREFYTSHKLDGANMRVDFMLFDEKDDIPDLEQLQKAKYSSPIASNEYLRLALNVFPIVQYEVFNDDYDNTGVSCFIHFLSVHLYCHVDIKLKDTLLKFEVSLLGEDNKILEDTTKCVSKHAVNGEIKIFDDNRLKQFIPYRTLVEKPEMYLPNNNLVIRCEVSYNALEHLMSIQQTKHFTNLAADFGAFWAKRELFSDFTLVVKGKSLHAHKMVLAARSPFFMAKFEETQEGRIEINDFDVNVFQTLLEYMYTGNAQLIDPTNSELISAGKMLGINGLESNCEPETSMETSVSTNCNPSTSGLISTAEKKEKLKPSCKTTETIAKTDSVHITKLNIKNSVVSLANATTNARDIIMTVNSRI